MSDKTEYDFTVALELPRLIERMHRRYLDLLSSTLATAGASDISPAQYMILLYLQAGEISVRELTERGYYLGSNTSYNLKQLVDGGYVERLAALRDKRAARLKLSDKGIQLVSLMRDREKQILAPLFEELGGAESCEVSYKFLRSLEALWATSLRAETADMLHFIE
jgi:DNA-binding MarR family transcriptional regulator